MSRYLPINDTLRGTPHPYSFRNRITGQTLCFIAYPGFRPYKYIPEVVYKKCGALMRNEPMTRRAYAAARRRGWKKPRGFSPKRVKGRRGGFRKLKNKHWVTFPPALLEEVHATAKRAGVSTSAEIERRCREWLVAYLEGKIDRQATKVELRRFAETVTREEMQELERLTYGKPK